MLTRTALYAVVLQLLAVLLVAAVVSGGGALLTTAGFVTPFYDHNLFAVRLAPVPLTDPVVYFSVQTLVQVLAVALAVSALITAVRTNPWHHGTLSDSTPPQRDRSADKPSRTHSGGPGAGAPGAGASAAQSPPAAPAP